MGISTGAAILGGSVLSGVMGADAAGDAADAQEAAAARSDKTQRYMYDTTRKDNMPMLNARNASVNELQYLLGLSSGQKSVANAPIPTYSDIRNQLLKDYTKSKTVMTRGHRGPGDVWYSGKRTTQDIVDEKGLAAAVQARLDQQQAARAAEQARIQDMQSADPRFGSLMRDFGQSDLDNDLVYQNGLQFGLDEGRKGINRMAAASGGWQNGATLKALTRFGNDYATTKTEGAWNRFGANKASKFNMLSGLAGTGQVGASQISTAGQNMANNISANQIGVGNARAASAIGQSNSWGNALSGGWNAYQQNNLLNRLSPQASFGSSGLGGWGDSFSTSYGE
jgi:hypothetical protein